MANIYKEFLWGLTTAKKKKREKCLWVLIQFSTQNNTKQKLISKQKLNFHRQTHLIIKSKIQFSTLKKARIFPFSYRTFFCEKVAHHTNISRVIKYRLIQSLMFRDHHAIKTAGNLFLVCVVTSGLLGTIGGKRFLKEHSFQSCTLPDKLLLKG